MSKKEVRPWGQYVVLYETDTIKVKEITVNSDSRLSLQSHEKRSEEWFVVSGELGVTLGKDVNSIEEYFITQGDKIIIPLGYVHRAFSRENKEVVFIEVQSGTYFGEDDIVRYEDDYGRE